MEGKSQTPDKFEVNIEHSNINENQYGFVIEHKKASELHPIKLKRQVANSYISTFVIHVLFQSFGFIDTS